MSNDLIREIRDRVRQWPESERKQAVLALVEVRVWLCNACHHPIALHSPMDGCMANDADCGCAETSTELATTDDSYQGESPFNCDGALSAFPEPAREAVALAYLRSVAEAAGLSVATWEETPHFWNCQIDDRNEFWTGTAPTELAAAEAAISAAFRAEVVA